MKIPIAFIKINILLFFLFLIGSTSLFSQQYNVYITENGRIDFVSDAPLEIINAGASELKGAIDLSNQTFLFVLQNANFKGFNSPLQ
ncbi:MAG: hypothetical protein CVT92_02020 [Bacteroidetes bacterium HGW-Bacteroidetes-1]|jgi:hypothetical protein|nr:MAG: hypothetical protein CVT92_02020 [Bacteroidetes bacterium HGW-Bacteroidetes-1]